MFSITATDKVLVPKKCKCRMFRMDAQQAQAMQLIQQLAAQDPEIQILQQKAQFKAAIHEHTARCWEKCKLGQEAEQSSLSELKILWFSIKFERISKGLSEKF